MRINEIDSKHEEFKQIILDHNLSKEQLDEVLPLIGAIATGVGAAARAGLQAVGTAARAGLQAVGTAARAGAQVAGRVAQGVGRTAKNMATPTPGGPNKSQGTIGSQPSQSPQQQSQAKFVRGQKIQMPTTDKSVADFEVKNATSDEVELRNPKQKPGEPVAFKFKKKDIAQFVQPPQ
jgi:hypothetical protein